MQQVRKTSVVDLVVEAIRIECTSGAWNERIPGVRSMAEQLGVSPPTVSAALEKLVASGLIVSGGERRPFRVAKRRGSDKSDKSGGSGGAATPERLLILVPMDISQLADITRRLVDDLRQRVTRKGWQVDLQIVDFLHAKRMHQSWDQKIEVDAHTRVIAVYGRIPLAEWALKRKVRMLFLGGDTGGLPVSMIAVKASDMAADALARLTTLGHSRIIIPLCDRTETFKNGIQEVTRQAIEATGATYLRSYHNPESPFLEPDVTRSIVEALFEKQAPTAFVFLDWKELVTTYCVVSRMGLRVPEEVSLILLNEVMEAGWFHPSLARFQYPVRRLVSGMVRWLEDDSGKINQIRLSADYIDGASISRSMDAS